MAYKTLHNPALDRPRASRVKITRTDTKTGEILDETTQGAYDLHQLRDVRNSRTPRRRRT